MSLAARLVLSCLLCLFVIVCSFGSFVITTKTNLSLPSDTSVEIVDVHKGVEVLAG